MLYFFRLFFPTWSFFDKPEKQVILQYQDSQSGLWYDLFTPLPRRWYHFLFNPEVNHYYACQSHLERWVQKLAQKKWTINSDDVDYKITERMVRQYTTTKLCNDFQFRLVLRCPWKKIEEVLLISHSHSLLR